MTTLRTAFLDPDYRREPKTDFYCVRCQKPIMAGRKFRYVHLLNDGWTVVHPDHGDDVADSLGLHPVGLDCARKIGLEFTSEVN